MPEYENHEIYGISLQKVDHHENLIFPLQNHKTKIKFLELQERIMKIVKR